MIAENGVIIIEFIHRVRFILKMKVFETNANLCFLLEVFVHLQQFPRWSDIHIQYVERKETTRNNTHLQLIPKISVINFPHGIREN